MYDLRIWRSRRGQGFGTTHTGEILLSFEVQFVENGDNNTKVMTQMPGAHVHSSYRCTHCNANCEEQSQMNKMNFN